MNRPSGGGLQGGRLGRGQSGSGFGNQGSQDQGFGNQRGGQYRPNNSRNQGQNNFDYGDDNYRPVENYRPAESNAPQPVAVPSLPKPVAGPAVPIVEFTANNWIAAPTYPSRQTINRLRESLADVAATQLDLLDDLLKKSGLDRRRADALKQYARKTSRDEVSIRDFEKSIIDRDVEGAESAGELLKLDVTQLRQVLIYLSAARLRERYDALLEDDDTRAQREFRSEARDLRKRLADIGLDRQYVEAIGETVDEITATMNARVSLGTALAEVKELGDTPAQLKWNTTDELDVILDPTIKPGTVYYLTPESVLAGTQVSGRVNVLRSTLAGAFSLLAFDAPAADHSRAKMTPLSEPSAVTIVNPGSNAQSFSFQLNGYDFKLEPGTMREFTNSDTHKLDTLRFAPGDDGAKTGGFKLTEQDGSLIKKAYFSVNRAGAQWSLVRRKSLPYLRDTAVAPRQCAPPASRICCRSAGSISRRWWARLCCWRCDCWPRARP